MGSARYKITRKIADGGMAELYLGVQRGAAGFARPIVVKRVRAAYCADPATREALVDEAHVAMSLIHSNIVQVLDLGFAAGRYFLVLELVDGWDLSVLLDRARHSGLPLPPELALHVTAEVCRALAFAHGKAKDGQALHIVHRDVNPHNVLVSEQGEVKLTDFGIATARTRRRARTLVGVVKGKLGYMSPEQAAGEELDARSDLFSLGCTLYEAAAGAQPFTGGTDLETLLRMEQCAFRPLAEVAPGLHSELGAIIRRAMQKAKGDRYASAEEMLRDVERVQRTAFRPAGQSELKAWLAELARRDQIPTIGRRPASEQGEQGELAPGTSLVLEEIESDPGRMLPRTLTPDPQPPLLPDPPRPETADASGRRPTPTATPAAQPRLAAPMTAPTAPVARPPVETVPVEPPGLPRAVISGAIVLSLFLAAMTVTVFVAPRVRRAAQAVADGGVVLTLPVNLGDAGLGDSRLMLADGEVAYPLADESVVTVETVPPGASVSVGGKPMGASPVDLRLKTDQAHEIRLEKAGYRVTVRRVTLGPGKKPTRITTELEKLKWYMPE